MKTNNLQMFLRKTIKTGIQTLLIFSGIIALTNGYYTNTAYADYTYYELITNGMQNSVANNVNNNGVVVGGLAKSNSQVGYIYNGGMYTLLMPLGWDSAYALKINESGTVVGNGTVGNNSKGYFYDAGILTEFTPPNSVGSFLKIGRAHV